MLKTDIRLSKSHTIFIYTYISGSNNENNVSDILRADKHLFNKFWVDFRLLIGWHLPTNHLRQRFFLPVIMVVVVNILYDPGLLGKGNFYFKQDLISLFSDSRLGSGNFKSMHATKSSIVPRSYRG